MLIEKCMCWCFIDYELRIHQNFQHLTPEMVNICFFLVWNQMYLERFFDSWYSLSLMIRPTECQ